MRGKGKRSFEGDTTLVCEDNAETDQTWIQREFSFVLQNCQNGF